MEKMSRSERAKQFMPFSPLRGYDDELKGKEKVVSPKKELTEEESIILSETVKGLKKGDVVRIVYYDADGYVEKTGAVYAVDTVLGSISVIKDRIAFSEIYSIEKK